MCCSFVIPFFVLRVFFNSPPTHFYLWKQGLSDVLLFLDSFLCFGLKSIFNSPTQFHLWKQGLSDVLLFVIPFFVFGLKYFFQQSYPISTYESRDWVMCCSLWFLSLRLVLRVFSTPNFYLWAGLSDVLLLCDSFLYVWFQSIFQQFVLPDSLPLKRVFSTVLPKFYLWKQGLSDVLLFVIFLTFGLRVFFQSYPISTYESRDWVMCCSLWFSFYVWS
jgi:hypothetical protein